MSLLRDMQTRRWKVENRLQIWGNMLSVVLYAHHIMAPISVISAGCHTKVINIPTGSVVFVLKNVGLGLNVERQLSWIIAKCFQPLGYMTQNHVSIGCCLLVSSYHQNSPERILSIFKYICVSLATYWQRATALLYLVSGSPYSL